MPNVFEIPESLPVQEEYVEMLYATGSLLIERIISRGHHTPPGEWYDQDRGEWVVLLQGESVLTLEGGPEIHLKRGDAVFLLPHQRHRVEQTTSSPPCIWLAVHT
jgi:cupin 2 domain-containing protein